MMFIIEELSYAWSQGDWLGVGITLLFIAILAFLALMLLYIVFRFVDSGFLPKRRVTARIVGRDFSPAHTQTILIANAATKTTQPHFIHHPDRWSVQIEANGERDWIDVKESYYDSVSVNDPASVDIVTGRLSRRMYVKGIYS